MKIFLIIPTSLAHGNISYSTMSLLKTHWSVFPHNQVFFSPKVPETIFSFLCKALFIHLVLIFYNTAKVRHSIHAYIITYKVSDP